MTNTTSHEGSRRRRRRISFRKWTSLVESILRLERVRTWDSVLADLVAVVGPFRDWEQQCLRDVFDRRMTDLELRRARP
jgi:hypothetical protein